MLGADCPHKIAVNQTIILIASQTSNVSERISVVAAIIANIKRPSFTHPRKGSGGFAAL